MLPTVVGYVNAKVEIFLGNAKKCVHCRGVACNAPTMNTCNALTVIHRYYDKTGIAGLWDLQDFPNRIELILQNP